MVQEEMFQQQEIPRDKLKINQHILMQKKMKIVIIHSYLRN